jgi:glycosyltransferase involved in cell wall biosynthesis
MSKQPEISIIIPVYNEASGIEATLDELLFFAKDKNWEIIIVNDGSTDGTNEFLKEPAKYKVINHPYNKGYGASLKTGIKNAAAEIVVFFDGDGQHNPEDIPKLLEKLPNSDMVVGMRTKSPGQDWIRKPGKWILGKVANILSDHKIPDLNSGLRAIRKSIIERMLDIFPDGFSFSTTSTIAFFKLGYNVVYVPITVRPRTGKSTVRQVKHGPQVLLLILRLISLFSPLRIFLNVSAIFFMIGFIYQIEEIIRRGWHIVNGALLMIISAVLVFLFGLIADQLSALRLSLLQLNKNDKKPD